MKEKIIIIGGGVSGITTALTLQLLGFETTCIAEHLVDDNAPSNPKFASLYPAASVIPHSVQTDELETIFPASLAVFKILLESGLQSLKLHRHFEVYEFPKNPPAYTQFLDRFSELANENRKTVPHRKNAPDLHGWIFDCYVAEWPAYMHQLYCIYKQAGGKINSKKIRKNEIADLPADIIINCAGMWSPSLFTDPAERELIRGHLVHAENKSPIEHSGDRICSYNYTPLPSVYATPDGSSSDVYLYPIKNKWVLGGSRQKGTLNKNGEWIGRRHEKTIPIGGLEIPEQIITLNKDILKHSYGLTIDSESLQNAFLGYRYSRKKTEHGLRLETSTEHGKLIIHNYGHGGAGVTLSWGCSLKVFNLLQNELNLHFISSIDMGKNGIVENLQLKLQEVSLNYFSLSN